jgi:hypothetical protein
MSIKLAIIGSRSFSSYNDLDNALKDLNFELALIISGGARGADQLAESWANANKIAFRVILPQWKKYGKGAGIVRNQLIVKEADFCLIFWDGKSLGTKSTIDFCEKLEKPFKLILFQ